MNTERLEALRALMKERKIDIYVVPTADFHESEYVGEHFKARKFLTGFTGSAGVAVITKDDAGLWTDGRYFIQAEKQIQGSGFRLFKMGEKGVPTWNEFIRAELPEKGCIGFDGRVINARWGAQLEAIANEKKGSTFVSEDLVGKIWKDRPALSSTLMWVLDDQFAGETAKSKIERIREKMEEFGADVHILTSLDDIAWVLNLRGNDIEHFPVFLSYLVITRKSDMARNGAILYVQESELSKKVIQHLKRADVSTAGYEGIYEMADELGKHKVGKILLDRSKVNYRIVKALLSQAEITKNEIIDKPNPSMKMKSLKNPVEQENIRKAHIKDGVAMTKWLCWLDGAIGKEELTEISVADKLEEYRRKQENFVDLSFETIAAYEANAAMMHYSATPENYAVIEPKGFLLVDSGAHFLEGSTDITRTIAMGPITDEERRFFTIVLKANLNLAAAHFPQGVNGQNLDVLARGPFWDLGLDYRCGTGHGIGYLLNVHEGPNGFRWRIVPERQDSAPFEPGMVTTDEPGIYIENGFGIRTENELLCVPCEETEYGTFYQFETVTYCPIDLKAIDTDELTKREKKLLNDYHQMVYEKLSPYLNKKEQNWLKKATKEI